MKRWMKIGILCGIVISTALLIFSIRNSLSFSIVTPTPYEVLGLFIASIAILLRVYPLLKKQKLAWFMPNEIERTKNGFAVDLRHHYGREIPLFLTNHGNSTVVIQSVNTKTHHRSGISIIDFLSNLPMAILPNENLKVTLRFSLPHFDEEIRKELSYTEHQHGFLESSYCDIYSKICDVELEHTHGKTRFNLF